MPESRASAGVKLDVDYTGERQMNEFIRDLKEAERAARRLDTILTKSNAGQYFDRLTGAQNKWKKSFDQVDKGIKALGTIGLKGLMLSIKGAVLEMGLMSAAMVAVHASFVAGNAIMKAFRSLLGPIAVGIAGITAAASGAAAAIREQQAAMFAFRTTGRDEFGSKVRGTIQIMRELQTDTSLASAGVENLNKAFAAVSKTSQFTTQSKMLLKSLMDFASAGQPIEQGIQKAGELIAALQSKQSTFFDAKKAAMALFPNEKEMRKAFTQLGIGSKKALEQAIQSGKLGEALGVTGQWNAVSGTLISKLKGYMNVIRGQFADLGQPLLDPIKEGAARVFNIIQRGLFKLSSNTQRFGMGTMIDSLVNAVDKLTNWSVKMVDTHLKTTEGMFERMGKWWREFVYGWNTALDKLRPLIGGAKVIESFFGKIWGHVKNIASSNFGQFNDWLMSHRDTVETFGDRIGAVVESIMGFQYQIKQLIQDMMPFINTVLEGVKQFVDGMTSGLSAMRGLFGGGGAGAFSMFALMKIGLTAMKNTKGGFVAQGGPLGTASSRARMKPWWESGTGARDIEAESAVGMAHPFLQRMNEMTVAATHVTVVGGGGSLGTTLAAVGGIDGSSGLASRTGGLASRTGGLRTGTDWAPPTGSPMLPPHLIDRGNRVSQRLGGVFSAYGSLDDAEYYKALRLGRASNLAASGPYSSLDVNQALAWRGDPNYRVMGTGRGARLKQKIYNNFFAEDTRSMDDMMMENSMFGHRRKLGNMMRNARGRSRFANALFGNQKLGTKGINNSMMASMATTIGMSYLSQIVPKEAQGSLAMGAMVAQSSPIAGIGVGLAGTAMNARTGMGGMMAGAGAGAAFGSFFGLPGIIAGTLIGGILGGIRGAVNKASIQAKSIKQTSQKLVMGLAYTALDSSFTAYSKEIVGSAADKAGAKTVLRDVFRDSNKYLLNMQSAFSAYRTADSSPNFGTSRGGKPVSGSGYAYEQLVLDAKSKGLPIPKYTGSANELRPGKYNMAGDPVKVLGDILGTPSKYGITTKMLLTLTKNEKDLFLNRSVAASSLKKLNDITTQQYKNQVFLQGAYNDKLDYLKEVTGKTDYEINALAKSINYNLFDASVSAREALKDLGLMQLKTADEFKSQTKSIFVDSTQFMDEIVARNKSILAVSDIARSFGDTIKATPGGLKNMKLEEKTNFFKNIIGNYATLYGEGGAGIAQFIASFFGNTGKFGTGTAFGLTREGKRQPLTGMGKDFAKDPQMLALAETLRKTQLTGFAGSVRDQLTSKLGGMGYAFNGNILASLNKMTPDQLLALSNAAEGGFAGAQQYGAEKSSDKTTVKTVNKYLASLGLTGQVSFMKPEKTPDLAAIAAAEAMATTLGSFFKDTANRPEWFKKSAFDELFTKENNPLTPSASTSSETKPLVPYGGTRYGNNPAPGTTTTTAPDTRTPRGDTTSSRLSSTMAKHSMIDRSLTGKRTVTSGYRNFALGSINSDHVTGKALDLVGQNLGSYAKAVKNTGGFAEFHGRGGGRHLHVVPGAMGDAGNPFGGALFHDPENPIFNPAYLKLSRARSIAQKTGFNVLNTAGQKIQGKNMSAADKSMLYSDLIAGQYGPGGSSPAISGAPSAAVMAKAMIFKSMYQHGAVPVISNYDNMGGITLNNQFHFSGSNLDPQGMLQEGMVKMVNKVAKDLVKVIDKQHKQNMKRSTSKQNNMKNKNKTTP